MRRQPAQHDADHGHSFGLTDALRRLREGRLGPPTASDVPPPSTFPMTPAARAARRLDATPRVQQFTDSRSFWLTPDGKERS